MSDSKRAEALRIARAQLATMTDKEDAAIRAAIESDPDTWEATEADFARARRGRPPLDQPKQQVTLRLDADTLAYFRSTGKGWQTRMGDILTRAAKRRQNAG